MPDFAEPTGDEVIIGGVPMKVYYHPEVAYELEQALEKAFAKTGGSDINPSVPDMWAAWTDAANGKFAVGDAAVGAGAG